jgi:hypothetical protein
LLNEDCQIFTTVIDSGKDLHEFLSCGVFFDDIGGKEPVFRAFQCKDGMLIVEILND